MLVILPAPVAFDVRSGVVPAERVTVAIVWLSKPAVIEVRVAADGDGDAERVLNDAFLRTGPAPVPRGERARMEPAKAVWGVLTLDTDVGLLSDGS